MSEAQNETYLGDGLYASCNGYQIVLRAPREGGDHFVALEPPVYNALVQFARNLGLVMTEAADILRKAKVLIDAPEKWTKNVYARDEDGHEVPPDHAAVAWCMSGACLHFKPRTELLVVRDLLRQATGTGFVDEWNDAPERTYAEVMDAFSRAIELAEQQS